MGNEPWRTWPELTLKIFRLPSTVTLAELHKSFSRHGNITLLELGENKDGRRNGFAKVRFEPPPEVDFWSSFNYIISYDRDKCARVKIELFIPRIKYPGMTESPANPKVLLKTRMSLRADQLDFGVRLQENEMMVHKSITDNVRIDVDLGRKQLIITFDMPKRCSQTHNGHNGNDYEDKFHRHRCTVAFARLTKLYQTNLEEGAIGLIIPLEHPAIFRTKLDEDRLNEMAVGRTFWGPLDMWERRTAILNDRRVPSNFPVTLQFDFDDPDFINIGRWTTLGFIVKDNENATSQVLEALHAYNIETITLDHFKFIPHQPALLTTLHRVSPPEDSRGISFTSLSIQSLESTLQAPPVLDFQVHYQLEACISRGVLSEYSITHEFLDRLRALDKDRAKWTLEYFTDRGQRVWNPMEIFDSEEGRLYFPNASTPHYCTTIRKIVVTPTVVYYNSPSVESSNRVLRKYSIYQDRFLRVQFTDELYNGKIYSDSGGELFSRVYRALAKGITIGSRHYEFLAFGNSQIRESAVYFFCPTEHLSCDQIRDWMGHFSHIKNVAKYAARIGQCFSTTREIRGVTVPKIVPIEDIEQNGYCFSDGVGKISQLLAKMVVQEMRDEDLNITPSAFQFRMGGCKGMLVVWPDAKNLEVHIRQSQEKFKAKFNGLEIIKYAQTSTATLNRQTITVLTSLGVRAEVILKLAELQINNYQKAMNDRVAAVSLLGQYIDENLTSLTIKDLVGWGFIDPEIQEPFVLTILNLWRIWSMKLLKEKARVIVEKSAFLLGCLDETGILRGHLKSTEGKNTKNVKDLPQVFLQIESPIGSGRFTCVTGLCIVGRNPSLHPGDIRVMEAVDVPELHHLRNVVVFPRTGDRDVPSMMSGGDLDGDDFFVMWDLDLIPDVWHQPPMNYVQPTPAVLRRDVQVKDLRAFFVRYMQNDSLALIATAHLAHADRSIQGVKDPKCLKLAALHSKAVDYVKTGNPAKLPKELNAKERPHFLTSRGDKYHSSTALGKLYDMIQDVGFRPLYEKSFDQRILGRYKLSDDLLCKARGIKAQYDTAMRRLMGQRDIETEFEIWTGFVLSKPRIGSDYKQQEDVGRESSMLKQRFRDICYKEIGGRSFEDIAPFVASMYKVTQDEVNAALKGEYEDEEHRRQSMPLISFPWIFHWIMGRIATGQVKTRPTIDPDAAPLPVRKTHHFRRADDEAEPVTQLDHGRLVHRGELLEVFESPTDKDGDEVSVSSRSGDATGGQEIHVEDEESAMDAMDRLMGGAMG
ncbi:suppressor of ascus dominance [Colletotrichum truncatum]|uniref:Suppressor of ascus dominance n=1 Tax=Colletotrichum truncatum TaxID=5467 RepID=A0ACC3Z0Q9_COLTU|nr:suppressor of ascus dominance [Colletotrichum truncatum]KAF6800563.1 suppressor of ascus dominance [Colletotrichum truncatum]